jgi:hypothetical protein
LLKSPYFVAFLMTEKTYERGPRSVCVKMDMDVDMDMDKNMYLDTNMDMDMDI